MCARGSSCRRGRPGGLADACGLLALPPPNEGLNAAPRMPIARLCAPCSQRFRSHSPSRLQRRHPLPRSPRGTVWSAMSVKGSTSCARTTASARCASSPGSPERPTVTAYRWRGPGTSATRSSRPRAQRTGRLSAAGSACSTRDLDSGPGPRARTWRGAPGLGRARPCAAGSEARGTTPICSIRAGATWGRSRARAPTSRLFRRLGPRDDRGRRIRPARLAALVLPPANEGEPTRDQRKADPAEEHRRCARERQFAGGLLSALRNGRGAFSGTASIRTSAA
jgi:hypothetical protein